MKKNISIFMVALALSACGLLGGGPSDDELKELLSKDLLNVNKAAAILGPKYQTHLVNFTNHGCSAHKTMKDAYTCDLEITAKSGINGEGTSRVMASYGKTKDGVWYEIRK